MLTVNMSFKTTYWGIPRSCFLICPVANEPVCHGLSRGLFTEVSRTFVVQISQLVSVRTNIFCLHSQLVKNYKSVFLSYKLKADMKTKCKLGSLIALLLNINYCSKKFENFAFFWLKKAPDAAGLELRELPNG